MPSPRATDPAGARSAGARPGNTLLSRQLANITKTLETNTCNTVSRGSNTPPSNMSPSKQASAPASPSPITTRETGRSSAATQVVGKMTSDRVSPRSPQVSLRGGGGIKLESFKGSQTETSSQLKDTHKNPRLMLAELERNAYLRTKTADTREHASNEDLEALRHKLNAAFSPPCKGAETTLNTTVVPPRQPGLAPQVEPVETMTIRGGKNDQELQESHNASADMFSPPYEGGLDQETLRYVLACYLERAGTDWHKVMGWTEYLFSDGPNGYKAIAERDAEIKTALQELDELAKYTLAEEAKHNAIEEETIAPCRLIAANLAADVDKEAIAEYYKAWAADIKNIRILDERVPIRRTRTAYIDMYTRNAAWMANNKFGFIYGLMVHSRLAVEKTPSEAEFD